MGHIDRMSNDNHDRVIKICVRCSNIDSVQRDFQTFLHVFLSLTLSPHNHITH